MNGMLVENRFAARPSIPRLAKVAACVAGVVLALDVHADFQTKMIETQNESVYAMWVTVYDLGKTRHLDYGCVPGKGGKTSRYRQWTSGRYLDGSYYYVRAQVQSSPDCKGETLCDTTMQVHSVNGGNMYVVLKAPSKNRCHLQETPLGPSSILPRDTGRGATEPLALRATPSRP